MHGALLVFWVLLIVPTLLLGWYKSIPYLVFISMYANIASHAAGWSADSE
jgi:hypothetical protein